ncbi:hypothetical protein MBLNU457_2107t1 [Dothideomycetes sp. NU457]
MSSTNNILLIIGAGPGISNSVAHLFASQRFSTIVLIARSTDSVERTKQSLQSTFSSKTLTITTHALDIANLPQLRQTLTQISSQGTIECVLFNAARVRMAPFFSDSTDEISYDFAITNLALYEVAKWAMPQLVSLADKNDAETRPSLIVTNSLLPQYPIPALFSLSLTKAAQRNLVQSLSLEFAGKGVNVALVSIGGRVDESMNTLNPKTIAERIWGVYRRPRGEFRWDTEIMEGI